MPAIQQKAEIDVRAPAAAAFAIVAGGGSTRVTLHSWRDRRGLSAWLEKVFGSPLSRSLDVSLRKRLAYVQFQAERQS